MAKTSMVNRDIKRVKLAKKFADKRAALKKIIASTDASFEDKFNAASKLAGHRLIRRPQRSNPCRSHP